MKKLKRKQAALERRRKDAVALEERLEIALETSNKTATNLALSLNSLHPALSRGVYERCLQIRLDISKNLESDLIKARTFKRHYFNQPNFI